ncbi:GerMN domain-containing protein [Paenibacillus yanchengensis]|uniref:GerMN domain-containing protein n=1 Tax=Paenibacillus yanchengensis TaxID=2035833 RepID=A0ABW4YJW0_9BACL
MRNYNNRLRMLPILVAALMVLLLAGCGANKQPVGGSATPDPSNELSEEKTEEQEIVIYGVDLNGEELVERTEKITYKTEQELVEATLQALQAEPNEDSVSPWKKIIVHSVQLDQNRVKLDIAIPSEAKLGAMGEQQFIEVLTKTLFQLEVVQEIELLVDGEQVESLMGHIELDYPLKKESQ